MVSIKEIFRRGINKKVEQRGTVFITEKEAASGEFDPDKVTVVKSGGGGGVLSSVPRGRIGGGSSRTTQPPITKSISPEKIISPTKQEFISQRQKDTFRGVPVFETIITNEQGSFLRRATLEEESLLRSQPTRFKKTPVSTNEAKRKAEQEKKRLEREVSRIITKQQRGKTLTASERAKLISSTTILTTVRTAEGLISIPKAIKKIGKEPSKLKDIPRAIKEEGKKIGKLLKASPTQLGAEIGTNILLFGGAGKVIKGISKISGVPKPSVNIKFVGNQRVRGNKVITDVLFKVGKKRVGVAKGVTIQRGKDGAVTLTKGFSGLKRTSLRSGETELRSLQKFIGKEFTKGKKIKLNFRKKIDIGKARKIRPLVKTKKIKSIFQLGRGRLVTKGGKRIDIDDFISLSNVFTRKDLNVIVGKTITKSGQKAKFIGLIKNVGRKKKRGFSLTSQEQQLFNKALKQVVSTASASVKSAKVKRLSPRSKAVIKTIVSKQIVKAKQLPKQRAKVKVKVRTKQKVIQKPRQKIRTRQRTRFKTKTKLKARQKVITKQVVKPKPRLRQQVVSKQIIKTKRKLKLIEKGRGLKIVPKIPTPTRRVPIKLKRFKAKKLKKKKVLKKGWNAFVKSKGKFIKVNTLPLSRTNALDRASSLTDRSTSADMKVVPVGKVRNLGRLRKGEKGHFKRTRKKFRGFKQRKGQKRKLVNRFIEKKGKPRIDTRGEKRGLSVRRLIKQRNFQQPKRRATPKQLKNLAKGRKIMQQNRKNKR